jgi:hypothetical protein
MRTVRHIRRWPATHFQEAGFVSGFVPVRSRQLLLTVDLEAFDVGSSELWCEAMAQWGREATAAGLRFSHFVSIEHVVRLRARHPEAHKRFVAALRFLAPEGSRLYPHNHCVFDPSTGAFPGEASGWPQRIPGYRPRASMFYDVVRRHKLDLAAWLELVTAEYAQLLKDAEVTLPSTRAFRPGGWDHGSSVDELRIYISALAKCGYLFDSSDAAGVFGTHDWHVGAPYGRNIYRLTEGVIEIAPSWSLTCGARLTSARGLAGLLAMISQPHVCLNRRPGLAVGVLHFDHLFHDWTTRDGAFGVRSVPVIAARINRLMKGLAILQEMLEFAPVTFDDLMPAMQPAASVSPALAGSLTC